MRALVVTVAAGAGGEHVGSADGTASALAELVSDVLFGFGAAAVEERRDHAGRLELWTHVGDDDADIDRVVAGLPHGTAWRVVDVDETAAEGWREHASATWVTDELVIAPAWKPHPVSSDALVLSIDPGAAFGFGDHPTTVLTLRALLERARRNPLGTVLDVGCGSGVLSVAAARLGAERVVAIDIASAAVTATEENARRNGVDDLIHASLDPLGSVAGTFDVVLANILAPSIIELAGELTAAVAPAGQLTISGILAGDEPRMAAALDPLVRVASRQLDGWAAVDFHRGVPQGGPSTYTDNEPA